MVVVNVVPSSELDDEVRVVADGSVSAADTIVVIVVVSVATDARVDKFKACANSVDCRIPSWFPSIWANADSACILLRGG